MGHLGIQPCSYRGRSLYVSMPLSRALHFFLIDFRFFIDACYVVHSYSRRLAQQKADDQIFPRSGPAYTPVLATDKDESHSLSRPNYSYPYADTTHSFGNATNTPPGSGHAAGYYNHNNNHV